MNDHQKFYSDIDPQRDSKPAIMHSLACYKFVTLGVVAISILLLVLVSHSTSLSAQPIAIHSTQVARFLQPPYYGTVRLNSVYDHEYPLYEAEANIDPENAFVITSTVRHYDGTRYWNLAYSGHNGIDYDLNYELVRTSAPGNVTYAGWREPANHQSGEGLYVRIRHNNNYHTIYGHMSVLRVRTGDEGICEADEFSCILGISGNTGHSTGPHLHFELEPPGSTASVNPYGWIGGAGNDPWQNWSGLASHDVWLRHPSITNGDVYPSGTPLAAPPINENEPGAFTVDDGDTGFDDNPDGCWTADTTAGWAGDHRWRNVPRQNPGNCTATWNFPGTPGYYNVFVYVPNAHATTDAAQYTIRHTESSDRLWSKQSAWAAVNQLAYPNVDHPSSWVYVGTYYFNNQYGTDYVRLESQPLDPVADTMMAADAVRFAPVRYRVYLPLVMKRWPPIPDTPVLNPINNPNGSSGYTVSWQEAYLADTYTLQEATNANFSGAVTRYSGVGTSWTASGKTAGTYYYRVKATNSWGDSGWSNVEQTTVWPTTTTFYSVADAMVRSGYPDTKYGGLSYVRVGYYSSSQVMQGLVRFDLSGIPSGTPIGQARLWLYVYSSYDPPSSSRTIATYRVTSSWIEGNVTWNTRPGFGGLYGFTSIPHADYRWYSVDVTNLVREWVSGQYPNYGVWIFGNESPSDPNYRGFYTREDSGGRKPYLYITYGARASGAQTGEGEEMLFVSPLATPEAPAMPEAFRSPLPVPEP